MIEPLVTTILLVALVVATGYCAWRHYHDVQRVYATLQDPKAQRRINRRRLLVLMAVALPVFAATVLIPDPWPSVVPLDIYDGEAETLTFNAKTLATLPATSWRPARETDLKTVVFRRTAVIVRAKLPAQAREVGHVARTRFATIARLDFLLARGSQALRRATTGLDYPLDYAYHRGFTYTFDIPPDAGGEGAATGDPRTLYVRVESEGKFDAVVQLLTEADFQAATSVELTLMLGVIGAFLGIMVYNLLLAITIRERIYVWYLVYQVLILSFTLVYSGAIFSIFPSLGNDTYKALSYIEYLLLLLTVTPVGLFYTEFLATRSNFPWAYRAMRLLIWSPCILAPVALLVTQGYCNTITLSFLAISIAIGLWALAPMLTYRYVMLGAVSLLGLASSTAIHMVSVIGLIPANFIVEFLYGYGCLWEALFLSIAIGEKVRSMRDENNQMTEALFGQDALFKLQRSVGRAFATTYVPREWNVTILFVTVPNFRAYLSRFPPDALFVALSRDLEKIAQIIRSNGGAVDRSLGHGLLCYFGYPARGRTPHAQAALVAARKIQQHALRNNQTAVEKLRFPYCIGINTADVIIADLSLGSGTDTTMVGSGVNLASRLNAACAPFRIMVSQATYDALARASSDIDDLVPTHIAIKHETNLTIAYESLPIDRLALAEAEKSYLRLLELSRYEQRASVLSTDSISLVTTLGRGHLRDFSLKGFSMRGAVLFAKNVVLDVRFDCGTHPVGAELRARLLHEVKAEVRWSRQNGATCEHGLRYIGLGREQKRALLSALLSYYPEQALENTIALETLLDEDDEDQDGEVLGVAG